MDSNGIIQSHSEMLSRLFISFVREIDAIDAIVQDHVKSLSRVLYSFEYFNECLIVIVLLTILFCYIYQNNIKFPETQIPTINSTDHVTVISWILTCALGFIVAISLQVIGFWLLYVYYFPQYDQDSSSMCTTTIFQNALNDSLIFSADKYIVYLFAQCTATTIYKFLSFQSPLLYHQVFNGFLFYMIRRMTRSFSWNDPIRCTILIFLTSLLLLPRFSRSYKYRSGQFIAISAIIVLFYLYPFTIWTWLKNDFAAAATFYLVYMPWHWNCDTQRESRSIWIAFAEWTMFDAIELGYSMSFVRINNDNLALLKDQN